MRSPEFIGETSAQKIRAKENLFASFMTANSPRPRSMSPHMMLAVESPTRVVTVVDHPVTRSPLHGGPLIFSKSRLREAPSMPPPTTYEAYVLLGSEENQDGNKSVTITEKLVEEQCNRWRLEKEYEEYMKSNPMKNNVYQNDITDAIIIELQDTVEDLRHQDHHFNLEEIKE